MTEFHHQLNGDYHHLSKVYDVTLYSGIISNTPQEGVILLFILPEVINILRTGTTFLFDGTFASAPSFSNECQQLYVIMGITFNTGFPIGFALMSRKTECAYSALFNKILTIVPEWQPQTIVIDFERAAIASIRSLFPNTVIRGCWFHSSNAVWRKVGNISNLLYLLYLSDKYSNLGLTELCTHNRVAYDIVNLLMALPLLPQNLIMEGFECIKNVCLENVQLSLGEKRGQFNALFDYYWSTWLQGVNADTLSVNDTVWRTNNVLEVSHQHLRMHMGNKNHPEPWIFLKGLITYSRGVLIDYSAVTDGEQIREPQRQFLVCSRHATPNFGVLRPQPLQIQPVNIPQPQPVNFPQPQLLHIEPVNALHPPSSILLELPHHRLREEILARLLPPPRIRQLVPPNLFDVSSDSDDEENVIV
ncbi:hypothetical protein AGLY_018315 [Aphis glycines]|uniref:MULE transposase domain-containing protein n=1 Tax=Aphis glycines TaxID=307491 RepID=A0A6G0SSE6_APHGL|nr:hypothetical protein AGLY_018315 [Aphis glycines]